MKITEEKVVAETPFAKLVQVYYQMDGMAKTWDGVKRTNANAAVSIGAVTRKGELIFVRQPRPLVGSWTIELPAGLCDIAGETPLDVARRELLEETGFSAVNFQVLVGGNRGHTVSAGITNERLFLVAAESAEKQRDPLENEHTKPILVPLSAASRWLAECAQSEEVDFKLFGSIELIRNWYERRKR